MQLNFKHFETIDSTNTYALKLLDENKESIEKLNGTVIFADSQTAGRGRMNRPFYSPEKSGIYLSLIYVPEEPVTNAAIYTATAAVGVCRAVKKAFGVETAIKWVNDVYLNNKKICGILTEGYFDYKTTKITAAVIGIGVNISTKDFPLEIKNKAGSILENSDSSQREFLLNQIASEVYDIYSSREKTALAMKEYKEKSFLTGKRVEVHPVISQKETYFATVLGISDEAKLIVKTDSGQELYLDSGEVSVVSQ